MYLIFFKEESCIFTEEPSFLIRCKQIGIDIKMIIPTTQQFKVWKSNSAWEGLSATTHNLDWLIVRNIEPRCSDAPDDGR
jgi:hypothetical protein